MGRIHRYSKEGLNKGAWTILEDKILTDYIKLHGEGKWNNVAKQSDLKICAKSCRLRWLNYLRPDIKRGNISDDEEELIIRLHKLLGNRWSLIAGRLPGRTDNEIKNYWNTTLAKKAQDPRLALPKIASSNDNITRNIGSPSQDDPSWTSNSHCANKAVVASLQHQQQKTDEYGIAMLGPCVINNNNPPNSNETTSGSTGSTFSIQNPSGNFVVDRDYNVEDFCNVIDYSDLANLSHILINTDHNESDNYQGDYKGINFPGTSYWVHES